MVAEMLGAILGAIEGGELVGLAVQQGGFALAAMAFGYFGWLIWREAQRTRVAYDAEMRRIMEFREQGIDRLLARVEGTEKEHQAMTATLEGLVQTIEKTNGSLDEVRFALARLNGRK